MTTGHADGAAAAGPQPLSLRPGSAGLRVMLALAGAGEGALTSRQAAVADGTEPGRQALGRYGVLLMRATSRGWATRVRDGGGFAYRITAAGQEATAAAAARAAARRQALADAEAARRSRREAREAREARQAGQPRGEPVAGHAPASAIDVARAAATYQGGATLRSLAKENGTSYATIRDVLAGAGVQIRQRGPGRTDLDPEAVAAAYERGESAEGLARRHRAAPGVIRRILADAGVEIRPRREAAAIARARDEPEYPWAAGAIGRYGAGESAYALAREHHVSEKSFRAMLTRNGVVLRRNEAITAGRQRGIAVASAWAAAEAAARAALPREEAGDPLALLHAWSARIDALVAEAAAAGSGEQAVILARIAELERCEAELRHVIGRQASYRPLEAASLQG